ncbi:tyrosine-type recombinase/integrase [Hyphomicrobium sp.]|uniref:tyrosine-type recombinase/integrase n=1 Tax=Hyphomicrobium sp. TaxID=82 RepID=UPI002D79E6EE|nr:integrase arm-type DNA-binding domain-containing protein [Hyphomicrobium sp.]HET6388582.1 integrase arm-type DNA-binding domain-containing protein [Hyphomicrobium sp.]
MSNSKRLTALEVARLTKPGAYGDGRGLMLLVKSSGTRSWILRISYNGKRRDFGLGGYPAIPLSKAREIAEEYRQAIREGRDPLAHKFKKPERQTFRDAAEATLTGLAGDKLGEKTISRMRARLEMHAYPKLGRLEVQSIDADVLAEALRPIWTAKPETARRVRQYIIRVLRFARPDGHLLEGALAKAVTDRLPAQKDGEHHAAMPYAELPAFMAKLSAKESKGSLALRFTILNAARSGETRGATWSEIDREKAVWEIPASRMKMRKAHRVPLSPEALAVVEMAAKFRRPDSDLLFPSDAGTPLSDMTLTKILRDMNLPYRVHGMRSTFADWRADETDYPEEIAEAALAHEVPDDVKRAYRRTDFFDRRRELMRDWAAFCMSETAPEATQAHADHPELQPIPFKREKAAPKRKKGIAVSVPGQAAIDFSE